MKIHEISTAWAIAPSAIHAVQASIEQAAKSHALLSSAGSTIDRVKRAYAGETLCAPVVADGIARFQFAGAVVHRAPAWLLAWSNVIDPGDFAEQVALAAAREDVTELHIEADSPGGTAIGWERVASAIQACPKPVRVRVDGLLCSAAFGALCPADEITAAPDCPIGSIGTYQVLVDSTAAASASGYVLELVASSPDKGAGADGRITDAARAASRRLVDGLSALFFERVASARGLAGDALAAVTNGRVWLAAEAQSLGLIDAVAQSPLTVEPSGTAPEVSPITTPETDTEHGEPQECAAMALTPKALADLAKDHPNHAALILENAAADGATIDGIKATIYAADQAGKDAEIADLKAKLATSEGIAKASAEELAKFNAHLPPKDPGEDGEQAVSMSLEAFNALSLAEKDAHRVRGGKITD